MKADLHCHSIYSDGTLTPTEVVDLAYQNKVELFALTDHDSVAGLAEARQRCLYHGMKMLDAVEISATWEGYTIHIVGLNIDAQHPVMSNLLMNNQQIRAKRANEIIAKLAGLDIDVSAQLNVMIPEKGLITRTHLARALINMGQVKRMDQAFKKYLGKGKKAYVGGDWVSMEKAVQAINESGGAAVIAHPMRYRLGATKLDRLVQNFADVGGQALEIVTATQDVNQQARCAQLAKQYGLSGSIGSDFHSLDQPWAVIGKCPDLPNTVIAVWQELI